MDIPPTLAEGPREPPGAPADLHVNLPGRVYHRGPTNPLVHRPPPEVLDIEARLAKPVALAALGAAALLALLPPASAQGTALLADHGNLVLELGESVAVTWTLGVGCPATPERPVSLVLRPPSGMVAVPSALRFTACGEPATAHLAAGALRSGTVVVEAVGADGMLLARQEHAVEVRPRGGGTGPTLLMPVIVATEATSPDGAALRFSVGAVDPDGGAVQLLGCTPSLTTYPIAETTPGVTLVACSARDDEGLVGTDYVTVIVRDTTAPRLALPADVTFAYGEPLAYEATAWDLVTPGVAPSCAPAPGVLLPLGDTLVSCRAADRHGNVAQGAFRVSVVDLMPPTLSVQDAEAEATGPDGAAVAFAPEVADDADPAPSLSCSPASGSTFPLGDTTVSCTAADASGNAATATFAVRVRDTTPPALALPASLAAQAQAANGVAVAYEASASDAVDGAPPVACAPASGSVFPVGETLVRCEATDAAGNRAEGSFLVTVAPPPCDAAWSGALAARDGDPVRWRQGAALPVRAEVACADGGPRDVRLAWVGPDGAVAGEAHLDTRGAFVWRTSELAAGEWRLRLLVDGAPALERRVLLG